LLEEQITSEESKLRVANKFINESSAEIAALTKSAKPNPEKLCDASEKLQIGVKRKDKSEKHIDKLKKKIKQIK